MWRMNTEVPECDCGERIVIVVRERVRHGDPLKDCLVILEATEAGWHSPDETFAGYGPGYAERWAYERDIVGLKLFAKT